MTTRNGLMRRFKGTMLRRMHSMITCREFEEFVLGYLEGELPARQVKIFEWHLRICRECREYLDAYSRTIETGKAVLGPDNAPVPEDIPEDLVRAVLESRDR